MIYDDEGNEANTYTSNYEPREQSGDYSEASAMSSSIQWKQSPARGGIPLEISITFQGPIPRYPF